MEYYFTCGPLNDCVIRADSIVDLINSANRAASPSAVWGANNGKALFVGRATTTVSESENLARYELLGNLFIWVEPANVKHS